MKNQFIAVLLTLTVLSGCGIMNYIPEDYDGNEFMKLAELSVLSEISEGCDPAELKGMRYQSAVLLKYSTYTLKENIAEIYYGIHSLAVELDDRENPSAAYCRIKRQNIAKLTNEAMAVFGERKK